MSVKSGRDRGASSRGFAGRFVRNAAGLVAAIFLLIVVVSCLLAPLIAPYGPLAQDLRRGLEGPSLDHLLGTDALGRDVLSRLLHGGIPTLSGVALAAAVAFVVGVPLGLYAGYAKKTFDVVTSRISELIVALPSLVVLLLIFAINPNGVMIAMVAMGVFISPQLFRVSRAAALQASEELYVRAAEISGIGRIRIIVTHALPRAAGPIAVNMAVGASIALLISVGLQFLGLGIQEPAPSWGGLIQNAQTVMVRQPWLLVPPGTLVAATILAFIALGDGVRDSLDAPSSAKPASSRVRRPASTPATVAAASPVPAAPAGDDVLLRVTGLTIEVDKAAGPTALATDISFDVKAGECVGIVGESGCGKSLTASAILGLLPEAVRVVGGSCVFEGTDLIGLDEAAMSAIRGKRIALISQDPMVSLDPCYTVGNQLEEVLRRHTRLSRTARRARAVELLEVVKINDPQAVLKRYPHELSGGMAQRVVIALALAGEPTLLIADEPTTSLDVVVQAEIMDLIRSIQLASNLGVMLITHDFGVVAKYCDRVAVLYAGDVVERGTVDEVIYEPRHPYSAGLVACNVELSPGMRFPTIDGVVPQPGVWPVGCRFATRCPFATDACREPSGRDLRRSRDGRLVRCVRVDELGDLLPELVPAGEPTEGTSR